MGYCFDGNNQFDVFLSYASADDEAHNRWVSDFERYLNEKVKAELKRSSDAEQARCDLFRVCRDQTGFPAAGALAHVIDDYIQHSQFLFIFLGSGYLASEWCLHELNKFRQKFGGDVIETLERIYLIVLDRQALAALREGSKPSPLSKGREHLWKQIQGVSSSAIRVDDFLDNNELVPVFCDQYHADPRFHKVAKRRIVEDLARRLVERRHSTQPWTPHQPEGGHRTIVVGAVPHRLISARDELIKALSATNVRVIPASDLKQDDKVQRLMEGAYCFVQPFDHSTPIGSDLKSGGHLAVQKEHFEKLRALGHVASDARLIWWLPPACAEESNSVLNDEDKTFLDAIDALPESQRRSCTAEELSADLLARGQAQLVTATVWVEWEETDKKTIKQAKEKVKERFNAYCQRRAVGNVPFSPSLTFLTADWEKLEHKFDRDDKPDGVVIVYNEHKDFDALEEQSERISGLEDVLHHKMLPGLFYMRSEGMYQPDEWSVVRFIRNDDHLSYDPDELEEFVAKLFDVLCKKYPRLRLTDQP